MRENRKKKLIILSGVFILISTLLFYVVYENHYKSVWKHRSKRTQANEEIKASYHKNPNAIDAYDLMEYYIGEGEYELASKYGKACLSHGIDDGKLGGRVNFFVARSDHEIGDRDSAKRYLKKALEYSLLEGGITELYRTVKKYGMEHLLSPEEWDKYLSKDKKGKRLGA